MNKVEKPYRFRKMKSLEDFDEIMKADDLRFPVSSDLSILKRPVKIGKRICPNSLAVHPLEGFDGTPDGKPGELIYRRYERYGKGGAGLIWFEACAVAGDGRCNPRQMWIKEDTVKDIKKLVDLTNMTALNTRGIKPYNVLQLTHSGRTSKDMDWNPKPLVAFKNPYIDKYYTNITVTSDERLEQLEDEVVKAAELAAEAGFDSVDIKICHNYIMRELLSAFTRPGKYGGSFENRTRFLFNVIDKIQKRVGDAIDIGVRLNTYDSIPYPYGWGMVKVEGVMKPDLTEPKLLVRMLVDKGVKLINLSTMMPRYQPYGKGVLAAYEPGSEILPYQGTYYLLDATREIKQAVPEAVIVATGLSWFEQFGANVGAGGIEKGWFDIAGFGRQGFAYPDFAVDILDHGKMEHSKCCVTCDKCYELIELHVESGCVVRDSKVYAPIYKRGLEMKAKRISAEGIPKK
ncbi:MAG: NADH:flavin oxidoreductase [Treponemataceae bacterium]